MIAQKIKRIAQSVMPRLYETLRWRYGHPGKSLRVKTAILEKYGNKVIAGPFQGMTYINDAAGSAYIPKVLGTYESELHSLVDQIVHSGYHTIIDVGCAEGYYAVGLALHCADARVYAFDIDSQACRMCHELAEINGVMDRITVQGLCDYETLSKIPLNNALLICDAEGFEEELLKPETVTGLCSCDILVELHDFLRPGVTPLLSNRFEKTHTSVFINSEPRLPIDHPEVSFLSPQDQHLALAESRPSGQQWAFFRATGING